MLRSTPIALSALAILAGGCASYIDKPYQRIHVSTPGARNAECTLEAGKSKAIALPPQRVTIRNNNEPLKVTCRAPGNRVRQASYQPSLAQGAKYNIATGYAPGLYYDHVERSLYSYPENIVVDFKGVKERPNRLPDYQYATAPAPTEADIENMGPGRSLLSWEEKHPSSSKTGAGGSTSNSGDASAGISMPTPLPGKKDMEGAQSSRASDSKQSSTSQQSTTQANMRQKQKGAQNTATETDNTRTAAPVNIQANSRGQSQTQSYAPASEQADQASAPSSFEERARQQAQDVNDTMPQSGNTNSGTGISSPTQLY